MTVEEKLQHFYDVAIGETQKEASQMLDEHREMLAHQLEEHKKVKNLQAEQDIRAEIDHAKREVNKALSAEQLVIKRELTKKQTELKDKLFIEVKDKLEEFMNSPEYEEYLINKIQEALKIAGDDELHIYVTPGDASLTHVLSAATGLPVEVLHETFLGGIKAIIPEKNILIDYSFQNSFENLKKEFTFDGGMQHE